MANLPPFMTMNVLSKTKDGAAEYFLSELCMDRVFAARIHPNSWPIDLSISIRVRNFLSSLLLSMDAHVYTELYYVFIWRKQILFSKLSSRFMFIFCRRINFWKKRYTSLTYVFVLVYTSGIDQHTTTVNCSKPIRSNVTFLETVMITVMGMNDVMMKTK